MRLEGFLLIANLSALSVPAAALGSPLYSEYSEMIVFGDSLSDTGNVHIASTAQGLIPDPGFDGRLSNGPIWLDRLAERLTLASPSPSLTGGTNYAYAGAKTGTVALDLALFKPPFTQPYPVVEDPENYLFWDYIHPTTIGSQIIGDAVFDALAEDATQGPEPSSVTLVIIGIAVSIWQQSNQRRRMKGLCPLHGNPRSI